ncbi:MAG: terminase family protein [Opitutales bacterium]|nr:terminase family protein [Opitutales bacterium]
MPGARTVKARNKPELKVGLFLPYQWNWITDRSNIKLVEKSRQIGFSWATSYDVVREQSKKSAKLDAWISSRDEIQARLFLQDCKKFSGLLNIVAGEIGERIYKIDEERSITAFEMSLASNTVIHSMSSNPNAQAGKRGTRVLDEFALHENPQMLYSIALPGITWGGQMSIISTHRGAHNFFNKLVQEARYGENKKKISLHRVSLQDALDQGFLWVLQQKLPEADARQDMDESQYYDYVKSQCADEESFLQEYMCEPADESSVFITSDLFDGVTYPLSENWQKPLRDCGELYAGIDIGHKHDRTTLWVWEKVGSIYFQRKLLVMQGMKFSEQEAQIYPILALPNLRRACIDATGLGAQFAERAQERFGKYRIEDVFFTNAVKEDMAYKLRAAFEDRNIRIGGDRETRADFRSIKKEITSAGKIRFDADRTEAIGHGDRFWGAALALYAASSQSGESYIEQIPIDRTSRMM